MKFYNYIKLKSLGPLEFGFTAEKTIEILGPANGDMVVSPENLSVMNKIIEAIGFGMKEEIEKNYGMRSLDYEFLNEGFDEPTTVFLTFRDRGLEEIQFLFQLTPIHCDGINVNNPDTIQRTKDLYSLSPRIFMENDNIFFPELGIKYQQNPEDNALSFHSTWSVDNLLKDGFFEKETLNTAIESIEWYFDDDDDDE